MQSPASAEAREALERIVERRRLSETLSSRERVLEAVCHREADRVPIDLWVTREVKDDLASCFHLAYDKLLDAIGVDFRIHRGPSYVGLELTRHPDGTISDLWGVRRVQVEYGEGEQKGTYMELAQSPLSHVNSTGEVDAYLGWPSPDWWDYSRVRQECEAYSRKCIVFGGDRLDRTAQLKTTMYLRGVEQAMIDLILNPSIIECILEHVTDYYLAYNERVFEAARGKIDIFMMGDDFGTQAAPFMSVDMWERFFGRNFRRHVDLAHKYGVRVMHHTCGSVAPLIPKFIDAGLDILQSLQPRAANMDLAVLKQKYGKDIVFHGSIDIQQTMPYGSPRDVRDEVRLRMQVAKPGGGFIICTAHDVQRDVPLSNVVALLEAYHEFGGYSS
jgi:uroporphyrinogen decarboxylase